MTTSLHAFRADVREVFDFSKRPWTPKARDSCSQERDRTSRPYNYVFSDPTGRLVAKESLYRSSSRQLSSEIILKGGAEIVGGYYFQIQVGGQPIYVQIDTGSSTLVVPLSQCNTCNVPDRYNLANSTTGTVISCNSPTCGANTCNQQICSSCSSSQACCSENGICGFFIEYGDGTTATGALYQDIVTVGEYSVQATFAGADTETANFLVGKAAGVLGLAYSSLSCNPTCISPVFHQLVESFSLPNIFSVLINQDIGAFVVGGVNSSLYEGPIEYSSLANEQNPQFYDVTIESVQVNSNSLSIPSFNAIVDTGTTLIVASPYIFDALKEYFQTNFCNVPGLCPSSSNPGVTWFGTDYCVNLTPEELSQLPDIEFSLAGGVTLSLGPEHYMFHVSSNNIFSAASGSYCLGIQPSSQNLGPTSDGNEMILGNTLQLKYYLVFDRENKRIGFAKGKQLSS
ncbi:aspartyl protease isoform 1 [Galdieria sulphuraria]|nr:aspartyl protease isoform 1 [Galdieria sulphuraria]EME28336.1 aspartyl protease isoform 1 [Galdieria sulphuraria]|eukprot:XP_005704856.1 aspartyl protease isoform 1 [Galdieria sulphuraria]